MNFTSFNFLILFPAICIVYYLIPYKWRWIYLLIVSYVFYLSWQPVYGLILAGVTLISFFSASKLEQLKEERNKAKKWLIVGIVASLLPLIFFKYYNFINDSVFGILSVVGWRFRLPEMKLLLPLGISFFTFMAIGYMVDVYRGTSKAQKNIGLYALFISFFPQVTSGPIGRAEQLIHQLKNPEYLKLDNVVVGLKMMLWGYLLKLCVADRLGIYVDTIWNNLSNHNGTTYLLSSIFYTIQIYGDFAGYSLVAIGAARVMGIRLMDNFMRPYFSTSLKDFWRRWHISLSSWMRDYIYIPLGGSRVTQTRLLFNIFATMLISGLWHGAAWTFVFWGAFHGFAQVVQTLWNKVVKFKMPEIIKIVFCFLFVNLAWIFFRAPDFHSAFQVVTGIFSTTGKPFIDTMVFAYGLTSVVIVLIKDIIDEYRMRKTGVGMNRSSTVWVKEVTQIILLSCFILLFGVFDGGQFIYFQF